MDKKFHVKDFINWHGVESLFKRCSFTICKDTFLVPIFDDLWFKSALKTKNIIYILKGIGSTLLSYPTPWIKRRGRPPARFFNGNISLDSLKYIEESGILDGDLLFGLYIYFFIIAELGNELIGPPPKTGFSFLLLATRRPFSARFGE